MTIQFFGAARTVTGSLHLVSAHESNILLDCGLFQGKRSESIERNRSFPFDPSTIDAVILSHAHIDHAGNLPNLVKNGFSGPIYSTGATRDLCNVMLYDSAYLQERDAEFMSKRNLKKGEPAVEPLYTTRDVDKAIGKFVSLPYHRNHEIMGGIQVRFSDAGHILGSAVTTMEVQEGTRTIRLGFTGDLGRKNMPILKDPETVEQLDVLISESTYGGKIHEPVRDMAASLLGIIKRTAERGGKVIIPAFSVGRTQELVYVLFRLFDEGKLPAIPVYVDSPLAVNATEVFRMHPECFDSEMMYYLHHNEDPFGFGRLAYVRQAAESRKLNEKRNPCVIIAASGMCEGGRVLHHLANTIEDDRNTVLIVGYMAENTLGRRLVERQPEVKIFGDLFKLRAEVAVLNSFSAHAGLDELISFVQSIGSERLKSVFLVHGEMQQAERLKTKLGESGFANVFIPMRGDRAEFH